MSDFGGIDCSEREDFEASWADGDNSTPELREAVETHKRLCPKCAVPPPPLSFSALRVVNVTRCEKWHGPGSDPWTCADWSNAMCGESGELDEVALALIGARLALFVSASTGKCANSVKKIRRQETGAVNAGDPTVDKLKGDAGMELADVVIYADLLARHLGIDLGEAVRTKFNKVSEKHGFPERL